MISLRDPGECGEITYSGWLKSVLEPVRPKTNYSTLRNLTNENAEAVKESIGIGSTKQHIGPAKILVRHPSSGLVHPIIKALSKARSSLYV